MFYKLCGLVHEAVHVVGENNKLVSYPGLLPDYKGNKRVHISKSEW